MRISDWSSDVCSSDLTAACWRRPVRQGCKIMAGSVNKVILLGNLGKDPEIKTFQNGGKIANFSIATSASGKDRTTGEKKESTEWHTNTVNGDGLVGVGGRKSTSLNSSHQCASGSPLSA